MPPSAFNCITSARKKCTKYHGWILAAMVAAAALLSLQQSSNAALKRCHAEDRDVLDVE